MEKKFIGTDDLRRDLTDILDKLSKENGEIVITQRGKPQAVLLNLEAYLDFVEALDDLRDTRLIESIYKGAKEIDRGKGTSLQQLKEKLKL